MKGSFTERVADHFKAHAGEWIDGRDFEAIGGRYAWRSRISNCRTQLGMVIENRQRQVKRANGESYTISEYRYQAPVRELLFDMHPRT